MKKNILKIITAAALVTYLSGCGAIINMRTQATQFDLQPITKENLEEQPVKNKVFHKVKSVTIANYIDYMDDFPKDNKRIYKVMIKSIQKTLEESGEFKVVSADKFRDELKRQNPSLDLLTDESEELHEVIASISRGLGVHAVIDFDLEEEDNISSMQNQFTMMGDIIASGEIRLPMEMRLYAIRSKTGEAIYSQAQMIDWVSGTSGLQNTKTARLNEVVNKMIEPMVNDLVTSH